MRGSVSLLFRPPRPGTLVRLLHRICLFFNPHRCPGICDAKCNVAACNWDQGACPEEVQVTVFYSHKSNFSGINTTWTDTVSNTQAAEQALSNSKAGKKSSTGSRAVTSNSSETVWLVDSSALSRSSLSDKSTMTNFPTSTKAFKNSYDNGGSVDKKSGTSQLSFESNTGKTWSRRVGETAQSSLQTLVSQSSTSSSTTGGGTNSSHTKAEGLSTATGKSRTSSSGQEVGNIETVDEKISEQQYSITHILENTCPSERPHLWQEGYHIQSNRNWESIIFQKLYWCTPYHEDPVCPSLAFCKNEQCSECCTTVDGEVESCGDHHKSVSPTSSGKTNLATNLAARANYCLNNILIPGSTASAEVKARCKDIFKLSGSMGRRMLMNRE